MMGVKPDKTSFTSDYFQELYDYCIQMLKEGTAYADDTEQDEMRKQRMDGLPSKRRDTPPEESIARFEEMKTGSEEGMRWCIRAKISVDDPNKALRDPVICEYIVYMTVLDIKRLMADLDRCSPQPHHRTGSTWKVYPTYDFCCPVVDSIEGVTHALRTTEYRVCSVSKKLDIILTTHPGP